MGGWDVLEEKFSGGDLAYSCKCHIFIDKIITIVAVCLYINYVNGLKWSKRQYIRQYIVLLTFKGLCDLTFGY